MLRLGGTLLAALLLSSSALAEPPTQTLVCRGGGPMRVTLDHVRDVQGTPTDAVLFVRYKKALAPAATTAPAPGECALLSNAFKQSDPNSFFLRSLKTRAVIELSGDGRLVVDGSGMRAHADSPDANERRVWETVLQASVSGQPFAITVYPPVALRGEPLSWAVADIAPLPPAPK